MLNAKGKMDAHVFVYALEECFLVDAHPILREKLRTRLERYIIADDVQIEDVTDQFSLFHVLSGESPDGRPWQDCFRASFCEARLGHMERRDAS